MANPVQCGKNRTFCVSWVLLVVFMCILVVGDVVVAFRGWNTCTIDKNVGRWPVGMVVCMVVFDSVTSGTKFRREKYSQLHLIGIAAGYFGSIAWNIIGTIWFAKIYGVAEFQHPSSPTYCDVTTYWYVFVRIIVSWVCIFFGSIGVVIFLVKTRCQPQKMVDFLTEFF